MLGRLVAQKFKIDRLLGAGAMGKVYLAEQTNLSKQVALTVLHANMAGMVCGTPDYMSPEQARGDSLDGRSDLYAAAVILYQMVPGDVPLRAESALGVITKHLTEEPRPPSQRRSNATVPAPLEAVIM